MSLADYSNVRAWHETTVIAQENNMPSILRKFLEAVVPTHPKYTFKLRSPTSAAIDGEFGTNIGVVSVLTAQSNAGSRYYQLRLESHNMHNLRGQHVKTKDLGKAVRTFLKYFTDVTQDEILSHHAGSARRYVLSTITEAQTSVLRKVRDVLGQDISKVHERLDQLADFGELIMMQRLMEKLKTHGVVLYIPDSGPVVMSDLTSDLNPQPGAMRITPENLPEVVKQNYSVLKLASDATWIDGRGIRFTDTTYMIITEEIYE